MVLFFSYLGFIRPDSRLLERLETVDRMYARGDFEAVENIFHQIEHDFSDNEKYQIELANYLMKTGQYERIIQMRMLSRAGEIVQEDARRCLDKLRTQNIQTIAGLIDLSPNSFQVLIAAAKIALESNNYGRFNNYTEKAKRLNKDSKEPLVLEGHFNLLIGNVEKGLDLMKSAGMEALVENYERFYKGYKEAVSEGSSLNRFKKLKAIYFSIKHQLIVDVFTPSIYSNLEKKILEQLVQTGCDSSIAGTYSFSSRLVQISPVENNKFMNVKAHAIEGLVSDARKLLNSYKDSLTQVRVKTLLSFISLKENAIRDNERREKERREREQEQKERERRKQQSMNRKTPKAGEDFLGYYKTLGVNSKSNPKEIKKAHRTMVKKLGIAANTDKVKGEELKKVNKAFQIISDPKTKALYDQGVNPESPQESHSNRSNFYGGDFIVDDDINEILKSFFGGDNRRRSHQRTQYFYF